MIYRVGRFTADGGGYRSWQDRTAAVYADGGCIKANPSPDGGTWAWVAVDADGWMIHSEHGWFDPPAPEVGGKSGSVLLAENNQSEFLAILLALRGVKAANPHWNGLVYTDSKLTIRRWTEGASLANIPYEWRRRMGDILRMPGEVGNRERWTLLDGHPTAAQLEANIGKRGGPVSVHNRTCDKLCTQAAVRFHHPSAGLIEEIDIGPLDSQLLVV